MLLFCLFEKNIESGKKCIADVKIKSESRRLESLVNNLSVFVRNQENTR